MPNPQYQHVSGTRCEAHAKTTSGMATSCNSVINALVISRLMTVKKVITRGGYCFLPEKMEAWCFVRTLEPFIACKPQDWQGSTGPTD